MEHPVRTVAGRLSFICCWLVGLILSHAAAADAPPNVVMIISDDQGWADIGYNNPRVYSPNLDRLAAAGAVFTNHYVMPQCTPTRAALMTGRYPSRFGGAALQASNEPAFPRGTSTLAGMLRDHGYSTFLAGKWHLGSSPEHGPNHFGFDHSYGSLAGAVGMYDHRYREGPFEHTWHRDHERIPGAENGTHATDLVTAEAVRVIEAEHEGPFFLYLPYHAVHTPLDERGRFVDTPMTLDEQTNRWRNEDEIEWFNDPAGLIQSEPDPEKRLFLAAVHHFDHAVGQVVAALERTGQRENTLILFSSDNGPEVTWTAVDAYPDTLALTDFNQPSPWRGRKLDVWEGGIRVPAFANWPGRIEPREIDQPVHIIDWFPTLAAIIGAAAPDDLDGIDISAMVFGGPPPAERDLYWTWGRTMNRWALRQGRWKIVKYGRGAPADADAWRLFDLQADPAETTDVAAQYPDVVSELRARFLAQRARNAE